ncbi:hypothetical protein AAG906_004324 [Vitis piasezkii]
MQKIPYAWCGERLDQLEFIGYSDSTLLDAKTKIHIGLYLSIGGEQFHGGAKQTLVTSSTMEAEFVACYEASNQGIWLRNFVTRLRVLDVTIDVTKATLILCRYS